MRLDRKVTAAVLPLLLLLGTTLKTADAVVTTGDVLAQNVFERYFNWRLQDNPTFATKVSNHSYDDRLPSLSLASRGSRLVTMNSFLVQLDELSGHELSYHTKVSVSILSEYIRAFIDGDRYSGYVFQSSFLYTPGKFLQNTVKNMKFRSENDYRNLLKRYAAFPRYMQEVTMLLRLGIEEGMVFHNVSMETVPQLLRSINVSVDESEFFAPFQSMPLTIREPARSELRTKGQSAVRLEVLDEILQLADFIETEYLPSTREAVGVSSLPNGEAYYAACLKFHTTTDLTAEQIHQMGIDEVARIEGQMKKIAVSQGFSGTNLTAFSEQLLSDPSNFHTDPDELLLDFTNIIEKRIQPHLKSIVWQPPEDDVIVEMKPVNEKNAVFASYQMPAFDGSRPGEFKINAHRKMPKYEMLALALHEANPGHHLYFSAIKNNAGLPKFQRARGDFVSGSVAPSGLPANSATVEGWALYAESLGESMGLYEGRPIERYGGYSSEMHRACRLVVDTGLHAFNWTQQRAVDYLVKHVAAPRGRLEDEVRRYITWPGQATAYKVGELRIKELRRRAIRQLADRFDLRTFHQVVLDCAGPLAVVERCVNKYIGDDGVWMTWGVKATSAGHMAVPRGLVVLAALLVGYRSLWGLT